MNRIEFVRPEHLTMQGIHLFPVLDRSSRAIFDFEALTRNIYIKNNFV
jgi:hypothetical protein